MLVDSQASGAWSSTTFRSKGEAQSIPAAPFHSYCFGNWPADPAADGDRAARGSRARSSGAQFGSSGPSVAFLGDSNTALSDLTKSYYKGFRHTLHWWCWPWQRTVRRTFRRRHSSEAAPGRWRPRVTGGVSGSASGGIVVRPKYSEYGSTVGESVTLQAEDQINLSISTKVLRLAREKKSYLLMGFRANLFLSQFS